MLFWPQDSRFRWLQWVDKPRLFSAALVEAEWSFFQNMKLEKDGVNIVFVLISFL